MDENHLNRNIIANEIDLRVLILVLWKKKTLIICITIIMALLSGIVSVFLITPVYHSKLNIIINMPNSYRTKYGEYTLPITTNEQYISLITSNDIIAKTIKDMGYDEQTTIESIRKRITINIKEVINDKKEQNSFDIEISANDPEEARKLAQTLYYNYTEFIDILTIEGAIDYHINKFSIDLSSLEISLDKAKESLTKNELLLSETPQTINQKEAMNEIYDLPNISDYVILERVINPNYTKIETDIIETKQEINSLENNIRIYKQYLEELYSAKESLEDYKLSGDIHILDGEFKSITKTNIYLPSDPIAPSSKSSPHNLLNVVIGALVGGVVGLIFVYIKEFWFKSDESVKNSVHEV